jgi:dihydrofolate reductase/thymidylate synthase
MTEEACPVAHEEQQYLDLVKRVLEQGVERSDRTGTGTLSLFGATMRFDLGRTFPLFTTKKVFWKGVVEELLWFVAGKTNSKDLSVKGVRIWDGNGSREFLDGRGLQHREEGDLGPVYGFQWRHWGATYADSKTDYSGQGFDQLAECIRLIKTEPTSRRIVMSAWNVSDLETMALPPCHMFCQFYVAPNAVGKAKLSCLMYQRSCDLGLGVPFNVASYALLTRIVAQVCDLEPGELVVSMGDVHVYLNHVEPLKLQIARTPAPFPSVKINPDVREIGSFTFQDFELQDYQPHEAIRMSLSV